MASNSKMTRWEFVLQIIIFCVGFLFAVSYYVIFPEPINLQSAANGLLSYLTAMLTVAFAIGVINLTRIHLRNVKLKRTDWKFSLILLLSLYSMIVLSILSSPFAIDPQGVVIPISIIQAAAPFWSFLYYNVLVSIDTSVFALLAFFVASAAYRAFKIRSVESTILLVIGLFVIIGQAPVSNTIWPGFSAILNWIMTVPNTAGQRGILIGSAVGILAFSIRRMLRYSW